MQEGTARWQVDHHGLLLADLDKTNLYLIMQEGTARWHVDHHGVLLAGQD